MMDENNRAAASHEIRLHQLVYPDERVVVFLAKNYRDRNANKQQCALDVGCGSGRHLRLLLDYGFQSYGIDYSEDAIDVARNLVDKHPLFKELKAVDLAACLYPDSFFQVVICWGEIFLRPLNEMLKDLQIIHRLLSPGGRIVLNFRYK
jgi:SAM-dependent methyltransferase